MVASTLAPTKESYEEIRQRNIAANRSLLLSLQLAGPGFGPTLIPKGDPKQTATTRGANEENSKTRAEKKRRKSTRREAEQAAEGEGDEKPQEEAGSRRRSGRIQKLQARKQNKLAGVEDERSEGSEESEDEYDDQDGPDGGDSSDGSEAKENSRKRKSTWKPPSGPKRPRGSLPPQRKAKSLKGHRPNPKIFGQQVGTEVGDWWDSRMLCSQAGVHAPPVCGIAGSDGVGCYSVALSGGYEDDVDLGYAFTFTGSGGRALSGTKENPKNLRTAPQSSDQEFTAMNASVRLSCELKNPVRVIRGFKNHSPFAPESGYRYDGLYRVEKAWREAGQSGFQVCKITQSAQDSSQTGARSGGGANLTGHGYRDGRAAGDCCADPRMDPEAGQAEDRGAATTEAMRDGGWRCRWEGRAARRDGRSRRRGAGEGRCRCSNRGSTGDF
ncbi:hypothetical protein PGTUg99_031355 [Puccinia graminis f. sp. tritici]|uniref:YDG domain-containing protein n=1 Tax=Puccinia graminis f. sp. tritici TaxID=56615 RepID=A0A5B0SM43_PUCGR|nr:hypothetical protein PGTUg99_031355 [Puccinia graminis f. sp. tritici]